MCAIGGGVVVLEEGDSPAAIDTIELFAGESERIGGSRAQHDLVTFTLLKAYLNAGRLDDARRLLRTRRRGSSSIPVAGLGAVHGSTKPRRPRSNFATTAASAAALTTTRLMSACAGAGETDAHFSKPAGKQLI